MNRRSRKMITNMILLLVLVMMGIARLLFSNPKESARQKSLHICPMSRCDSITKTESMLAKQFRLS